MVRRFGLLLVLGNILLMAACGGGGGGSSSSSTVTRVSVACSPSTVTSGQTSQCSATVSGTGAFSSAVTWSSTAGAISQTGLLTAPTVTTSLLVTVTAISIQDLTKSGTAAVTVNPSTAINNVQPIVVDAGPEPQTFLATNEAYTTITICVPGTTTCQTIDHIQVDTGSAGLRLLSGVLTIPLPQANDSSGNPLDECLIFLDGFIWGPVAAADLTIAGEKTSSMPMQIIISPTSSPPVPTSCSSQTTGGNDGRSVQAFGANGIIGVGVFQQDCGVACTTANSTIPDVYYDCPPSGCNPTYVTLTQQVPNPVSMFAVDNNGVLIQLPFVPDGGSASVTGSLIFGIGTQSNNGLGTATVYAVPSTGNDAGDITTVFNGNSYPGSFIDSGSNGLFFLDTATSGVATCTGSLTSWYCPATSPDQLSAGNQGTNMTSPVTFNFSLESASALFNTSNTAFSTLGGPNPGVFDWGLPFFYGRNMYTAIENTNTPGGNGPYFAY